MTGAGAEAPLSAFDFALPAERIAQHPVSPRDAARLLHVGETLADRHVRDLPDMLRAGDVLVVNDTAVIPARFAARRGAARIDLTLDQPLADGAWRVLARNARRLHPGDVLEVPGEPALGATVLARAGETATLRFAGTAAAVTAALDRAAAIALPPYIARPDGPSARDRADYQTVYARDPGAVAAPTAGLHFTPDLLHRLEAAGIARVALTLHVGAGTFLPVRADDPARHQMHEERGALTAEAAQAINAAREAGGRIVAVGTTALRTMESAADAEGWLHPFAGTTDLFIRPGYRIRTADLLLTNFHLPRSTLFMLVCAFAGTARMHAAYAHAIAAEYRFYSYGDATLLERA